MNFLSILPFEQIHVLSVFASIFLVLIADIHGLLWILSKIKVLPYTRIHYLHRAIWIGLCLILISGTALFIDDAQELRAMPLFWLKMFFVFCLFVNAFVIGKHFAIATQKTFSSVTPAERRLLYISGAVSTMSWIGAFVVAQTL